MEVQWNQILLTSKQDSFHCRGEALHALQVWAPCVSADSIRAAACGGVTVSTGRVGNSFARGTVNRHGASAGREALFCNLCWMQPVVIYQTIRIEAQQSALCEPHTSVCRGRWFRTLRRTSRIYATCCCWPIITERYELFGVGSCVHVRRMSLRVPSRARSPTRRQARAWCSIRVRPERRAPSPSTAGTARRSCTRGSLVRGAQHMR